MSPGQKRLKLLSLYPSVRSQGARLSRVPAVLPSRASAPLQWWQRLGLASSGTPLQRIRTTTRKNIAPTRKPRRERIVECGRAACRTAGGEVLAVSGTSRMSEQGRPGARPPWQPGCFGNFLHQIVSCSIDESAGEFMQFRVCTRRSGSMKA